MFGFGPVVPDGFGIGYIIKDDGITVCASSKHLQTKRFLDTLEAYLVDTQRMVIELYKAANVRSRSTYIDHAGVECDVRTGLPIGSKSNGYSQDYDEVGKNSQVGQSGYSFWGDEGKAAARKDGEEQQEGGGRRKRLASVGKTILYDEYN